MANGQTRYGVAVELTLQPVDRRTGPYLNDYMRTLKGCLGDINQMLSEEIDWDESREFEGAMMGDKCQLIGRICSCYREEVANGVRDLASRFLVDLWKLVILPADIPANAEIECVISEYQAPFRDSYSDDDGDDDPSPLGGFSLD